MGNQNQTLDSITSDHDTQMKIVISKTTDKIFDSMGEAAKYGVWCIQKAFDNLGVKFTDKTPSSVIDGVLKERRIEVQRFETIDKHQGIFFYEDDELQYFISDVEKKTGAIIFHKPKWLIRTNVT